MRIKDKKEWNKRVGNLFDPDSFFPLRISRSKLELFINCPRCFYLDKKHGVAQPQGAPFRLNLAVDLLLKKEFDYYRERQLPHPLFNKFDVQALPFAHPEVNAWRDTDEGGLKYKIPGYNVTLTGSIDDVWFDPKTGELIIAEYKATSKLVSPSIDTKWKIRYKRQVEVYQWLLRKNGFAVSNTAYFVYCNGIKDKDSFNKQLNFDMWLIPYEGNDSWVEETIVDAFKCLQSEKIPASNLFCDYCKYVSAVTKIVTPVKRVSPKVSIKLD